MCSARIEWIYYYIIYYKSKKVCEFPDLSLEVGGIERHLLFLNL